MASGFLGRSIGISARYKKGKEKTSKKGGEVVNNGKYECGFSNAITPIKAVLQGLLQDISLRIEDPVAGLKTGFAGIDRIIGGVQQGQVVIVAGNKGSPTTPFFMGILHHFAIEDKAPVGVILPFGERQNVLRRLLIWNSGVSANKMLSGHFSREDLIALDAGAAVVSETSIWFASMMNVCSQQLAAACRLLKEDQCIRAVFVDLSHPSWFRPSGGCAMKTRLGRFHASLLELKRIASELEISIVVLKGHWPIRAKRDRYDKDIPVRFSGEEAVDTIIQLEELLTKPGETRRVIVHIATGDIGHAGMSEMTFDGASGTFREVAV